MRRRVALRWWRGCWVRVYLRGCRRLPSLNGELRQRARRPSQWSRQQARRTRRRRTNVRPSPPPFPHLLRTNATPPQRCTIQRRLPRCKRPRTHRNQPHYVAKLPASWGRDLLSWGADLVAGQGPHPRAQSYTRLLSAPPPQHPLINHSVCRPSAMPVSHRDPALHARRGGGLSD
jgi:hypothetical protein